MGGANKRDLLTCCTLYEGGNPIDSMGVGCAEWRNIALPESAGCEAFASPNGCV